MANSEEKKIKTALFQTRILLLPLILIIVVTVAFKEHEQTDNVVRYCENNVCEDYNRIFSKGIDRSDIKTTAKKVMIVAHPDDETLWGSSALYNEKYLVVCITCGGRKDRVREFEEVMSLTGDDYIMLNYPDLVKGKKSDWKANWKDINKDIQDILSHKDWDLVVTHNPDGEYGHIHHKMTNQIVTKYANHDKLTYFGKFYWGKIPNEEELYRLKAHEFAFKSNVLIPVYATQTKAIDNLKNMVHYESWITYNEWYGDELEEKK